MLAMLMVLLGACSGQELATAQPGERLSIFTHCGIYEVVFDDVLWTPASIERGSSPEGTDFNSTEGTAKVVEGKLIFVADSGLELIFVPASPDLPPIPGCD